MKIIEGCNLMARENTAAASFWDSPYHLSVRVEGCRLMKRNPASLAVALAIRVFPQPGGPYSSTPEMMTSKQRQNEECSSVINTLKKHFHPRAYLWVAEEAWILQTDVSSGSEV